MNTAHLYTDEGLRVLLAEDWFIYVVNEAEGLIYTYNTELWPEWGDDWESGSVGRMIPFAHDHRPERLAKSDRDYCRARGPEDQMTIAEWEADHAKAVTA